MSGFPSVLPLKNVRSKTDFQLWGLRWVLFGLDSFSSPGSSSGNGPASKLLHVWTNPGKAFR